MEFELLHRSSREKAKVDAMKARASGGGAGATAGAAAARNAVPPLFPQSSESFADVAAAAAAAGKSLAVRENQKNHVLDASTMRS